MVKTKTKWVCQECGFVATGYLGKCTECQSWGSLTEELLPSEKQVHGLGRVETFAQAQPVLLTEIGSAHASRISSGIPGLDEVLGGGLVPGAVILLAGDPGIGKSTLLLQVARNISVANKVLYVAGEESANQVRLRASRLGMDSSAVHVGTSQNAIAIADAFSDFAGGVAIVDSIQSVFHPALTSAPGSVSQVRESAQVLISAAKAVETATIMVGHVTKEGAIAGPRVLEHMVDVVLYFEGDRARQLRIVRAVKNRFGSTQELALFTMTGSGLSEVENPSELLLGDRLSRLGKKRAPAGTAIIASGEGSRSLLMEVQALVSGTNYASPRRVVNGWDSNRLLQVIAVLEKKVGVNLSRADVYVNIVGGLDIEDPAGDLGVSVAIASSTLDRSVDSGTIFIGEVGLTGEIRPVVGLERRIKEAARLGFKKAVVPQYNLPIELKSKTLEVIGVETLSEVLNLAIPGADSDLKSRRMKEDEESRGKAKKVSFEPESPMDRELFGDQ